MDEVVGVISTAHTTAGVTIDGDCDPDVPRDLATAKALIFPPVGARRGWRLQDRRQARRRERLSRLRTGHKARARACAAARGRHRSDHEGVVCFMSRTE